MLKVGLTGGIGAGKSIVGRIFRLIGVPVYDADAAAKKLMHEDETLKSEIILHFGPQAYADGILNRSFLASEVFSDPVRLELLNRLVHPVTIRDAEQWFTKQNTPYAIKEAALLFESGTAAGLDYIIGVTAPLSVRISRTMQRDKTSKEKAEERIKNQLEDSLKMKLCDAVIRNDETQLVIPQVLAIHEKLLFMLKEKNQS